jgi:hypothetical protein
MVGVGAGVGTIEGFGAETAASSTGISAALCAGVGIITSGLKTVVITPGSETEASGSETVATSRAGS